MTVNRDADAYVPGTCVATLTHFFRFKGGHRVPWIMRWDDGPIRAGASLDHLVGIQDLYSTLLDLAEIKPSGIDLGTSAMHLPSFDTDTLSFKAGLLDSKNMPRRDIFVTYPTDVISWGLCPAKVLACLRFTCRVKRWKAIFRGGGKLEFVFNLAEDPGETSNLLLVPGSGWEGVSFTVDPNAEITWENRNTREGYEYIYQHCSRFGALVAPE